MCSYSWRVPFHVLGDLRIVASGELGDLGPAEGQAVSFKWNLLYSLSGLVVWSILVVALLARPNRSTQGWLILVPVLVGVVILLVVALFTNNIVHHRQYPKHWF